MLAEEQTAGGRLFSLGPAAANAWSPIVDRNIRVRIRVWVSMQTSAVNFSGSAVA